MIARLQRVVALQSPHPMAMILIVGYYTVQARPGTRMADDRYVMNSPLDGEPAEMFEKIGDSEQERDDCSATTR